jgi:hypothetical protein
VLPSLAVAAVLGIGGVSAGAALGGGGHHSSPLPPSVATPAVSTPASPATTTAPTSAAAVATATAAALPDFAITVTGRVSWVGVVGPHGQVLYAGLLRHGRTLTYRQRPLTVTLGDAGAVRLVLHHRAAARAGRPGQVLRFTVR